MGDCGSSDEDFDTSQQLTLIRPSAAPEEERINRSPLQSPPSDSEQGLLLPNESTPNRSESTGFLDFVKRMIPVEDNEKEEVFEEVKVNDQEATEKTGWTYCKGPLLQFDGPPADTIERKQNFHQITGIVIAPGALRFSAQIIEDGAKIEKMAADMRQAIVEHPPLAGSYPGGFAGFPAGVKEYNLALIKLPNEDYVQLTLDVFTQYLLEHPSVFINIEYKVGTADYVTVYYDSGNKKVDIGKALISEGLALSDPRREPRLQTLVAEYKNAEDVARKSRKNIWEYEEREKV